MNGKVAFGPDKRSKKGGPPFTRPTPLVINNGTNTGETYIVYNMLKKNKKSRCLRMANISARAIGEYIVYNGGGLLLVAIYIHNTGAGAFVHVVFR